MIFMKKIIILFIVLASSASLYGQNINYHEFQKYLGKKSLNSSCIGPRDAFDMFLLEFLTENKIKVELVEKGYQNMLTGAYIDLKSKTIYVVKTKPLNVFDSVLYEANNARNADKFSKIKYLFNRGKLTVMEFGRKMAKVELISTLNFATEARQVKKECDFRKLSNVTERTIAWAEKNASNYQFEGDYISDDVINIFSNTPHDPNGEGESLLTTAELYSYNLIKSKSDRIASVIRKALSGSFEGQHDWVSFNKFRDKVKYAFSKKAVESRPYIYNQTLEYAIKIYPQYAHRINKEFMLTPAMMKLATKYKVEISEYNN